MPRCRLPVERIPLSTISFLSAIGLVVLAQKYKKRGLSANPRLQSVSNGEVPIVIASHHSAGNQTGL